ncbi:hypothetical protein [Cohnella hashimotonis]|uniref:Uncharacterized protein n=1 Tax=Cohnella hashimotonis TaxID=2826895 RepID=A0ABT6TRR2_9BACL|nr:hypothetical protein [Cohnella hashimotonis]MDI4648624.1 hypothetical protein [Cohnella hashimotonis]
MGGARSFLTKGDIVKILVDGGALLFFKRNRQYNGTELQVEFVRRTWLGWKWGMGGGCSIGYGEPGETGVRTLLNYMTMPNKYPGVPYTVQALDEQGNVDAEKTLADPINDTGDLKTNDSR